MANYNKNVRPVRNNSDVVNVKVGLKLIQIADVVSYVRYHNCTCFLLGKSMKYITRKKQRESIST